MKKQISLFLAVAMLAALLTGCGSGSASGAGSSGAGSGKAAETKTIQIAHANASNEYSQCHVLCTKFAECVAEASGGALTVEVLGDGQLGGERDMVEGMKMGTIDMCAIANFSLGSFCSEFQVLDLPYLFNSKDEAFTVFDDAELMGNILDVLDKDWNIKVLGFGDGGFRQIIGNVGAITSPADFSGVKMRVPETAMYVSTFKALGANPVTMAWGETFTAIQQKTADALEVPIMSIYPSGYYEICKNLTISDHIYTAFPVCISGDLWDSLSEEEQGWLQQGADEAIAYERTYVNDMEGDLIQEMNDKGCTVNTLSEEQKAAFKTAVQPVYEEFRDAIGSDVMDLFLSRVQEIRG